MDKPHHPAFADSPKSPAQDAPQDEHQPRRRRTAEKLPPPIFLALLFLCLAFVLISFLQDQNLVKVVANTLNPLPSTSTVAVQATIQPSTQPTRHLADHNSDNMATEQT
jgi:hypothetical protein